MMLLAVISLGSAVGIVLGTLGGGGSVLVVPALVYGLGESVSEATSVSLAVVMVGALAGAIRHAQLAHVAWRHAGAIIGAAAPGILAGTLLGNAVGRHAFTVAFATVMLLGVGVMWQRGNDAQRSEPGSAEPMRAARLGRCSMIGALVGATAGFLGVGSGFLIVPMLTTFLAMSMRVAVGTSGVIIAGTACLALIVHIFVGRPPAFSLTVTMSIACATGAVTGATLSRRLPVHKLRSGFALLVTTVAIYLVLMAFLGGPPGR